MKRVTASEARKNWFRLLDEAVEGATIVIERKGRRILLRREEESPREAEVPDYSTLIRVPDVQRADEWGWRCPGDGEGLEPEEGG